MRGINNCSWFPGNKIEKKEETYSEILVRLVKGGSKTNLPGKNLILTSLFSSSE